MKLFVAALCIVLAAAAPADKLTNTGPTDFGFSAADANGDGKITRAELTGLFNAFDDNKNNAVDLIEFITHFSMGTGLSAKASGYVFFLEDTDESGELTSAELDAIFLTFDLNGDGEVSPAEYAGVMQGLLARLQVLQVSGDKLEALFIATDTNSDGLTPQEFATIFARADTNGDSKLSEAEFVAFWMSQISGTEAEGKALFTIFDGDKDGFYGSSVAERAAVLAAFDDNGDGKVSLDEFNYTFIFFAAKFDREAASTGPVGY